MVSSHELAQWACGLRGGRYEIEVGIIPESQYKKLLAQEQAGSSETPR